jgi:hypothetical protein
MNCRLRRRLCRVIRSTVGDAEIAGLCGSHRMGDRIWDRFNAGKDGTVWYYKGLAEEFQKAWPDNPLLPGFQALVQRMVLATR